MQHFGAVIARELQVRNNVLDKCNSILSGERIALEGQRSPRSPPSVPKSSGREVIYAFFATQFERQTGEMSDVSSHLVD